MSTLHSAADLAGLKHIVARTPDGSGNNPNGAGMAGEIYRRETPHSYGSDDGTAWDPGEEGGGVLPDARTISDIVMNQEPEDDRPSSYNLNEYHQFFGQFFTHDIAAAAGGDGSEALNIAGLAAFGPPGSPTFTRDAFELDDAGVRQNINEQTSFLDLSQVYGQTERKTELLRETHSGRLILGEDDLLPQAADIEAVHGAGVAAELGVFGQFLAGDGRLNQQAPLLSHHTVWARNHNHHADKLAALKPDWTAEEVFQAARALNEAEWQNVVYAEYAAKLFGADAFAAYRGYKAHVDPSIMNEYTTIANRFGHDQSSNGLLGQNEDGSDAFLTTLGEAFLNTSLIDENVELNQWIRGQLSRNSQEIDGKVVDGNRNLLFGGLGGVFDLEVLDIVRGRDHGVGNYNALREGLGLERYDSFDAFGRKNGLDRATIDALKEAYGDDIGKLDSVIGGLLEEHAKGSVLGETFTRISVVQFEAMRDGDKFFWLNRFKGDADLVDAIKDTSLAEIIARNTDVDYIYRDAFAGHARIGGGEHADALSGGGRGDLLIGFDGRDTIRGKAGDDDVYGGGGGDALDGGRGDDFVFGEAGRDVMRGGGGRDAMHGGAGDDRMSGGGGRDVFHFAADSGRDRITDFEIGQDKIDLTEVVGFGDFADVKAAMRQVGNAAHLALSDDDVLVLDHVRAGQFKAASFDFTDEYLLA